jgi:hypothetical protein
MKGCSVSKKKTAGKKKQLRPYDAGIQVPGDEALVKTTKKAPAAKPNKFGFFCTKGSICAEGTAVPPGGGILLQRVHARVYRLHETPPSPNTPPTDALARMVQTNGNLDWHFDEIPNAECTKDEPGNSDNKLWIWTVWDQGNPTQTSKEFRGLCSDHTDCDG